MSETERERDKGRERERERERGGGGGGGGRREGEGVRNQNGMARGWWPFSVFSHIVIQDLHSDITSPCRKVVKLWVKN